LAEALPASKWFFDEPPIEVMAESLAAAKRALELDDRLGDAHTALGSLLSLYDWNWPAAERELQRGLELNPNSSLAHQRYAMYLQSVGRLPEAVLESKQALALDPVSFFINREMGRGLVLAGRYDEALEQFHRAEELGPPGPTVISLWISQVYQLQGREKDAISQRLQVEMDTTTDRNTSSKEIESLRHAYATGGSEGYWREVIQLHSSAKQPPPQPYYMALAEARLGHADKAWEWMEKSADQREVWVTWIKVDPLLEGVRSAPGYQRLLRRMHLEE
jgi:tetratricopeptide (TPR) repeat protein